MNDGPWILVVDDDPVLRDLLREVLQLHGMRVTTLSQSAQALGRCLGAAIRPDLLVVDLHLPEFSGLQLLRILRQGEVRIPALAMSGICDHMSPDQMREIGCSAFLGKPFEIAHLLEKVEDLLGIQTDAAGGERPERRATKRQP